MAATAASLFVGFWIVVGLGILLADAVVWGRGGPLVRTVATPIEQLREGAVAKVVGTVRLSGEALEAPASGRPCACWDVRVHRRVERFRWEHLGHHARAGAFVLDDGTGEVLIPEGAMLEVLPDARFHRRVLRPALRGLLGALRPGPAPQIYRCDEAVIRAGSRVAVYGVFHREPDRRDDREDGYRARRWRMVADREAPVLVGNRRTVLG